MCFERSIQTKACLDLKYTQNDLSIQVIAIFQLLAKTKWQWHQLRCNYKCIGFLFSQEVAKPIYVVFTNSSSNACHNEKSTGSWQRTSQIIIFSIHTSKMLVFSLNYDEYRTCIVEQRKRQITVGWPCTFVPNAFPMTIWPQHVRNKNGKTEKNAVQPVLAEKRKTAKRSTSNDVV